MPDGAQYTVQLEIFEGPLDLLLTLIRRQSLDITAVSLAQVTGQYLTYMARLEEIDAGALAAFIEVAATLMLIKSRALLPTVRDTGDDEDVLGEAEELAERLRAYRQYREAAAALGEREKAGVRAFTRIAPPPDVPPAQLAGQAEVSDLVAALEEALAQLAREPAPPPEEVLRAPKVRLSERLADLRRLVRERRRLTFREVLLGGRKDREFIIVTFLAVLELLRQGAVRARQSELFGEIVLESRLDADPAAVNGDDAGGVSTGTG